MEIAFKKASPPGKVRKLRTKQMKNFLMNLYRDEQGQDLIEYALVVALIAFAAVSGMNTVATKINSAFTNIGTKLTTYTT